MKTDQSLETYFKNFYSDRDVIVTGGASFIGSNLVDRLLESGARVTVLDDFSSGRVENLPSDRIGLRIEKVDLRNREQAFNAIQKSDCLFHLAAVHGGRGFIETFKQEMLVNLAIDNNVFSAASKHGVACVVHASSACAYPIGLQESESTLNLLEEKQASMESIETSFPDGVYGWTKLLGEYQLENFSGTELKGRSARIFTAYGEKENESHAAIALIAKALLNANPFPIWGSGQQTRNFTYVQDTVTGLLLLGSDERPVPFDVFNIGTSSHVRVIDFVEEIFRAINWKPEKYDLQLDKPVGVASRASNNSKMMEVFDWEPIVGIEIGIARTISWYQGSGLLPNSLEELEERLMAR